MNYATRELSSLLRNFQKSLHDDFAQLANRLENLIHRIAEDRQANAETGKTNPLVSVTDFRTNVPIPVQDKTKKTVPEWIWAGFKGFSEILGIAAVVVYAILTYRLWRDEQSQLKLTRQVASYQGSNVIIKQPPDIGVIPGNVHFSLINSGRVDAIELTVDSKATLRMFPSQDKVRDVTSYHEVIGALAPVIMPTYQGDPSANEPIDRHYTFTLTNDEAQMIDQKGMQLLEVEVQLSWFDPILQKRITPTPSCYDYIYLPLINSRGTQPCTDLPELIRQETQRRAQKH